MPVRVQNFRSKVLIALPLLGVWAGLASGSIGAGAENATAHPVDTVPPSLAASSVPAPSPGAPAAADTLATEEAGPAAAPAAPPAEAPAPAAVSPAAVLVPEERLYLEPVLTQAAEGCLELAPRFRPPRHARVGLAASGVHLGHDRAPS